MNHQNLDAALLRPLFAKGKFELRKIYNEQRLDFAGLKGRVLSSSYMPTESHAGYAEMVVELERMFHEHADAVKCALSTTRRSTSGTSNSVLQMGDICYFAAAGFDFHFGRHVRE